MWVCVCVCVCVCIFFNVPFLEFNVVERIKETRQMAYLHRLMTWWSSELRHEIDKARIIYQFFIQSGCWSGQNYVWNCEAGCSIQATLFSLTFSHNHFCECNFGKKRNQKRIRIKFLYLVCLILQYAVKNACLSLNSVVFFFFFFFLPGCVV